MKNRIRVLRAETRMTQEDLANMVNVSRQTIISIENDKYSPSLDLAFKLAKVFETTIEDIFTPEE